MHALSTAAFISVLALATTLAQAMPQGMTVITTAGAEPTPSPPAPCTEVYIVPQDETCDTVAAELGLSKADILSLNPGLSCDDTIPAGGHNQQNAKKRERVAEDKERRGDVSNDVRSPHQCLYPPGYNKDVCVIRLDEKKFFKGNVIDLGPEIESGDFVSQMCPRGDAQSEFDYPSLRGSPLRRYCNKIRKLLRKLEPCIAGSLAEFVALLTSLSGTGQTDSSDITYAMCTGSGTTSSSPSSPAPTSTSTSTSPRTRPSRDILASFFYDCSPLLHPPRSLNPYLWHGWGHVTYVHDEGKCTTETSTYGLQGWCRRACGTHLQTPVLHRPYLMDGLTAPTNPSKTHPANPSNSNNNTFHLTVEELRNSNSQ
ncbi:hypothetical protein EDB89DRAFT_2226229 [Lactarius sanguifluus]|nr:hypothetical protein EDB89DRAFT_2226229 [Lactarius sanguifluus]